MTEVNLLALYHILLKEMGPQGWWPAQSKPEILIGAILVQNTSWQNVTKSLEKIHKRTQFDPRKIESLGSEELQKLIRPSGFYIAKSKSVRAAFAFFKNYDWNYKLMLEAYGENLRGKLLELPGIGPETADVLLVYLFDETIFIADKYARSLYYYLTGIEFKNYHHMSSKVKLGAGFDPTSAKEFHGLIDEFGKFCSSNSVDFNSDLITKIRNETWHS